MSTSLTSPAHESENLQLSIEIDVLREKITTVIGRGCKSGPLKSSGGVFIEGEVTGDVTVESSEGTVGTIVVAEGAIVHGTVHAGRVLILGQATNVIATSALVLGSKGRIVANTLYSRIVSADGAELEGYVKRIKPSTDPVAELARLCATQGRHAPAAVQPAEPVSA